MARGASQLKLGVEVEDRGFADLNFNFTLKLSGAERASALLIFANIPGFGRRSRA
jgi:hypothetical protein